MTSRRGPRGSTQVSIRPPQVRNFLRDTGHGALHGVKAVATRALLALFVNDADQPVAHAGFREEMLGLCRIMFELMSQVSHVDSQIMVVVSVRWPPHLQK